MKRVKLIHKEANSDCMEILKDTIVEDHKLKTFNIDENTLIHKLPEGIVNSFLDFISDFNLKQKQLLLEMIKDGTITLRCWDDNDEAISEEYNLKVSKKSQQQFKGLFDELDEMDVPF